MLQYQANKKKCLAELLGCHVYGDAIMPVTLTWLDSYIFFLINNEK